jgi:1-acyl-sn-glycerol-3-phosphate acyltransferase
MKVLEPLKKVDIEEVFKSKNSGLYKLLPGFVFVLLRKIIHENAINDFLYKNEDQQGVDFAKKIVDYFAINLVLKGIENIPDSGGCIIVSNHPIGSLDAMALVVAVSKRRKDIKFLVNDVLMNLENLRGIFVPVNKHGKTPSHTLREMETIYASDQAIMVFPAGLVSRKSNGKIRDLEWKKSFVSRAKKHHRPIVPVFISGRNSNFFYNLGNLRKWLGIKMNLEMLFLVNETFSHRNNTITLIFGEPIVASHITSQESDHIFAEKIRQHVYQMGSVGMPLSFHG